MKKIVNVLFIISLFIVNINASDKSLGWSCEKMDQEKIKKLMKNKKFYFDDHNRFCVELKESDLKSLGITIIE